MRTQTLRRSIGLAALFLSIASASATPLSIVMNAGTVIPVTLDQALSSDHSMKGDTFTATIRSRYLGMPEGTRVEGIVRAAVVKTNDRPGALVLDFVRVVTPNGSRTTIDGSPVGLDSKSVTTNRDGRLVAKSGTKNKRLTYVGYGAGAGALVSLLGGGKNFLQNTVIGGGLGYLVGALEKGGSKQTNNVTLKEGSTLGVVLHNSATLR